MGESKDPLEGVKKQWRIHRREMVTEYIGASPFFLRVHVQGTFTP